MLHKSALVLILVIMMSLFAQCAPASTAEQATDKKAQISIKLMTSLPIIWGESGSMEDILFGESRPAPIYEYWTEQYDVNAVDSLEELDASTTDIVMLVQPRAMAPADLAELDDWIRSGGDAVIMTDPDLIWPSDLPLGDPRRPLSSGLLSPLLKHWGLELVSEDDAMTLIEMEFADHKISTIGVGAFEVLPEETADAAKCKLGDMGFVAQCQIGKGRAILIADADFLHEQLWADDKRWQERGESDAMRFTTALIDQFYNVSKD